MKLMSALFIGILALSGSAQAGGPVTFANLQLWFDHSVTSFGTPELPKVSTDLKCQFASSKSQSSIQNGALIASPVPFFVPEGATYDKNMLMAYAKSQNALWEIQTLISQSNAPFTPPLGAGYLLQIRNSGSAKQVLIKVTLMNDAHRLDEVLYGICK